MTTDHDFKQLVRTRMAKTGESYVTARRQLRAETEDAHEGGLRTIDDERVLLVIRTQGHVDVVRETTRPGSFTAHGEVPANIVGPGSGFSVDGGATVSQLDDGAYLIDSDDHLTVRLFDEFDLRIEVDPDGHVNVRGGTGSAEVRTPDGHVNLWGDYDDVVIETGDGHLFVERTAGGSLATGDGNVHVVLSTAAAVDVRGERLTVTGRAVFSGTALDRHWTGVVAAEDDEPAGALGVQAGGRVTLELR